MKLLGKRVILIPIKKEELGIESIDRYDVAFIGDEVTKVKVGDTVVYEHGARLEIQGVEYMELLEENIVAIL